MKITYEVLSHEDDKATVRITPHSPINGFHGCDLNISRHTDEVGDSFIANRVTWKLNQEVGQKTIAESCEIEKI